MTYRRGSERARNAVRVGTGSRAGAPKRAGAGEKTMADHAHDWRVHGVQVIPGGSLDANTAQTPGMHRAAAINAARVGAQKIWAGTVHIHPDAKTGAHHHGDLESVIYVLRGRARMRWGERLEFVAEAGPGDFIFVPPFVPHQEINASSDETLECVLMRSGNEAVVVNLDIDPVEAPEVMAPRDRLPRACVMGHPIAQSRSPMLHGYWLKQLGIAGSYTRVEVPPGGFASFMQGFLAEGYVGGNVTAPHKQAALQAMSRVDAVAAAIGAVNTIWSEGGKLVGGNTDAHGFIANLDDRAPGWGDSTWTAVILGAGGAVRAAIVALRQRGVSVVLVNRTMETAEALAAEFNATPGPALSVVAWSRVDEALVRADLLVNATVLGMVGKEALQLSLEALPVGATVYDIVYVPLETDLLRRARLRGHRVVDGLGMLLHQAVPGFEHWFGAR
eukprot:gene1965-2000_t